MVKTYLKYDLAAAFGVIVQPNGQCALDASGRFLFTASLENVIVWDVKQGAPVAFLAASDHNSPVTSLLLSPHQSVPNTSSSSWGASENALLAVGHEDGHIDIWKLSSRECLYSLNGHKAAVVSLRFNKDGSRLVSGSKDTDAVVWDVIGESGLARLRGHKQVVTDVVFLEADGHNHIATCSADRTVKIWDMRSQQCIQTVFSADRQSITSMDVDSTERVLVTGGPTELLTVFSVRTQPGGDDCDLRALRVHTQDGKQPKGQKCDDPDQLLHFWGTLRRSDAAVNTDKLSTESKTRWPVACLRFSPSQRTGHSVRARSTAPERFTHQSESAWSLVMGGGLDEALCVMSKGAAFDLFPVGYNQPTLWQTALSRVKRAMKKHTRPAELTPAEVVGPAEPVQTKGSCAWFAFANAPVRDLIRGSVGSLEHDRFAQRTPPTVPSKASSEKKNAAFALRVSYMLAVGFQDNSAGVYRLDGQTAPTDSKSKRPERRVGCSRDVKIARNGHRTVVRVVDLSADDRYLLVGSGKSVYLWYLTPGGSQSTGLSVQYATDSYLGDPDSVVEHRWVCLHSWQCSNTVTSAVLVSTGASAAGRRDVSGLLGLRGMHVVCGLKNGVVELWDAQSAKCLERVTGHSKPVYGLCRMPARAGTASEDGEASSGRFVAGVVSAGGDCKACFWELEWVQKRRMVKLRGRSESYAQNVQQLSLVLTHTIELESEVLCVTCDPTAKYVACGLLDSTIKVFHLDSFKFFLSLYGHRLPVTSVDISSDGALLVSGSADKNCRLWGLDFGDCHKSLFGHQDSITQVRFVPNTHYFFSSSRDSTIVQWDGDTFDKITSLKAHQAEVNALCVSSLGDFVVSAGHDRSVRVFRRTEEILFLEEEREKEMEAKFEEDAVVEQKSIGHVPEAMRSGPMVSAGEHGAVEGLEAKLDPVALQRADKEGLKAVERLMDALDLCKAEELRWAAYFLTRIDQERTRAHITSEEGKEAAQERIPLIAEPVENALLRGRSPQSHVLFEFLSIPRSHVDNSLLLLPFAYAERLIRVLERFILSGQHAERCVNAVCLLVRVHYDRIVANGLLCDCLERLTQHARGALESRRRDLGFSVAALTVCAQVVQEARQVSLPGTAGTQVKARKNKKKTKKRGRAAMSY